MTFSQLAVAFAAAGIAYGCAVDPDQALVGAWTVNMKRTSIPTVPMPAAAAQIKTSLANTLLKIHADHTFQLIFFRTMEGTWSLKGDTLTLKAKGQDPIELQLAGGHSSATFAQRTPLGDATVVLDKTG